LLTVYILAFPCYYVNCQLTFFEGAMKTIEEIRERLTRCNLAEVARSVGLTRAYVWKIREDPNCNPSYYTIKKISDYLERRESK